MLKILITGTTGAIGSSLAQFLRKSDFSIVGTVRHKNISIDDIETRYLDFRAPQCEDDYISAVRGVDCIIHCAGITASQEKGRPRENSEIFCLNVLATRSLALAAAKMGVKKFIFLSTIKVFGSDSTGRDPFTHLDLPMPTDAYAWSKLLAERELFDVCQKNKIDVFILRLPLVYGMPAKGNIAALEKLLSFGIPLPFLRSNNKRSVISIDNLNEFILRILSLELFGYQLLLVSDGCDISTECLLRYCASQSGRNIKLFYFPPSLVFLILCIFGKRDIALRLFRSLQVDIGRTAHLLKWHPKRSRIQNFVRKVQSRD